MPPACVLLAPTLLTVLHQHGQPAGAPRASRDSHQLGSAPGHRTVASRTAAQCSSTELPVPAQGSEMGPAQKPEPLSPLNAGTTTALPWGGLPGELQSFWLHHEFHQTAQQELCYSMNRSKIPASGPCFGMNHAIHHHYPQSLCSLPPRAAAGQGLTHFVLFSPPNKEEAKHQQDH